MPDSDSGMDCPEFDEAGETFDGEFKSLGAAALNPGSGPLSRSCGLGDDSVERGR